MLLTLVLAIAFRSSDNLASAFGIAVAMTMLLTTTLVARCASQQICWPMSLVGQNPNAARMLACQLWPAADKPPHALYSAMCRFCCKSRFPP
jgi:K+ transporter